MQDRKKKRKRDVISIRDDVFYPFAILPSVFFVFLSLYLQSYPARVFALLVIEKRKARKTACREDLQEETRTTKLIIRDYVGIDPFRVPAPARDKNLLYRK